MLVTCKLFIPDLRVVMSNGVLHLILVQEIYSALKMVLVDISIRTMTFTILQVSGLQLLWKYGLP